MTFTAEQKKIIRNKSIFLIESLMDKMNCSKDIALETLMMTSTYEALMDSETELYLESNEAILDVLNEEMSGNPYRLVAM